MQTFICDLDFRVSAKYLDYRRLLNQRNEAWTVLQNVLGNQTGWRNHPAVKMWVGYERELTWYGITICQECRLRGYRDSVLDKFVQLPYVEMVPKWVDERFVRAHRSNLIRKNKKYLKHWPNVRDDLPYIWPQTYVELI